MIEQNHIRNFSIIAHIDHGKSTLADRLIEYTGTLSKREMEEQILDSMDLERERGITIKAQAVRSIYKARNGEEYMLNFIDTPGHVDFTYEVSRALAACEGALLVIDATQALKRRLWLTCIWRWITIWRLSRLSIRLICRVRTRSMLKGKLRTLSVLMLRRSFVQCQDRHWHRGRTGSNRSARAGAAGRCGSTAEGLVFDSKFDAYKGVVLYIRIMQGRLRKGMKIRMMQPVRNLMLPRSVTSNPALSMLMSWRRAR